MSDPLPFWFVDAFTQKPFCGNPAVVFVLDQELPDHLMQSIAVEMNQSETAFVLRRPGDNPLLRWFTPTFEIDLCGHATLASAHVFLSELQPTATEITFDTRFVGLLNVKKVGSGYQMDFPVRPGSRVPVDELPPKLNAALGGPLPREAYLARDLMLVYEDEETVRSLQPDWSLLKDYEHYVCVTALSSSAEHDYVCRFFCAGDGIDEDPVTGSAQCTLAPYWAKALKKVEMRCRQASPRGGDLQVRLAGERVLISGQATTVLAGTSRNL